MNGFNLLVSSKDLYNKLLSDGDLFSEDGLSTFKALNVATTAWHLTDWVYNEFENNSFNNIGAMRESFYLSCPQLRIMHDLATGFKHFTTSHPKSDMSGNHLHEGEFSSEFSFEFDVSCLMIDFDNGDSEILDLIFEKVIAFWTQYFENKA